MRIYVPIGIQYVLRLTSALTSEKVWNIELPLFLNTKTLAQIELKKCSTVCIKMGCALEYNCLNIADDEEDKESTIKMEKPRSHSGSS